MTQLNMESIEALANEDYSVQSGWRNDIYIDPRTGRVYSFLSNNSVPAEAYYNIDQRITTIRYDAVPESVKDNILAVAEELQQLLDLFADTKWNGNNHIGVWEGCTREDNYWQRFSDHFMQNISIKYYSEAREWFEDQDLKRLWAEGKTPQEVLDDSELDNGDGCCKAVDALTYLENRWHYWDVENEDSTPEPEDFTRTGKWEY